MNVAVDTENNGASLRQEIPDINFRSCIDSST